MSPDQMHESDETWDAYEQGLSPAEPLPPSDEPSEGIIPLGHDRGVFYYLSTSARQVFAIPAGQHTRNILTALASVTYYWQRSQFRGDRGVIRWDDATDWLMSACRAAGIYDPDRVRGRGAWMDDGKSVLHVGDALIVDGHRRPLMLDGSRYVYEAARSLATAAPPLANAEAHRLVTICQSLRWERPVSATLLAGWIAIAPICGGLAWRPSIWITAPRGSGKSYVEERIVAASLGAMALRVQSNTTEPALRRVLGSDARPVLFDEAESEGIGAQARMQAVLGLVRQSSSETGAEIVKASQGDGQRVHRFRIRSVFAFSSINVGIEHGADESRLTVLALRGMPHNPDEAERAELAAGFDRLNAAVSAVITPSFSAGLLSRSVRLLPIIRANAETLARAVSLHLGDRRLGDQLGTLLAGAYSLHSERTLTDEDAATIVRREEWRAAAASQAGENGSDESRLLGVITQHRHRYTQGEATIGRLILATMQEEGSIATRLAEEELRQLGIRVIVTGQDQRGVFVSNTHPALKRLLAATPWAAGWSRALARLPHARAHPTAVRFGYGHVSKAVWVPMDTIEEGGCDAEAHLGPE